ncbi:hypothetical protein [Halobacterium noricense]|uniref:hypothetical protein n=1 Tax=Halobacterium noricense TaxID=223182 RepID=UPI001E5EF9D0|nr:hypothetical protein [Halobacterium noricense]UHH27265.1 hypothetical protein LT974_17640 [Halobacterium noricense]
MTETPSGSNQPRERPPNKYEQALAAARDDPSLRELANNIYALPHVVEVFVDGEDDPGRPIVLTVGFDDDGHRAVGNVLEIMWVAGWRPNDATFAYRRLRFQRVNPDD